jgi:hypothetical protein
VRKRTIFERVLGAIFGAVLGGLLTLACGVVFEHWAVFLPMGLGALAGFWKGDRALFAMMRLFK